MRIKKTLKKLPFSIRQSAKYLYGLLPIRLRYGKVFWDTYNFLQESQWWSREKLEEYQMQQLSKLLHHAYENVPYYRKTFDERGLKPKDIQDFNDLKKLPLLDKDEIKKHRGEFISKIHKKCHLESAHTGGSTGSPLHFWHEKGVTSLKESAFFWRMWNWHDYHWGEKAFVIKGSYEIGDRIEYNPIDKIVSLYNPIINPKAVERYLKLIIEFKPKVIRGYPSLIFLLAHFIIQNNIKLDLPSLRMIFCYAEKIFDFQRIEIQEAFKCKITDHYGHNEVLVLMQKCKENKDYHIISEYGVTEVIGYNKKPEVRDDQIREIVGTGFNNYAFPMIRYRTKDWAVISKQSCKCGRVYPLIKDIIGRSGDFILTPSGKLVSPTIISFALRYIKNFKDIQIVQTSTDIIEILVVPDTSYTEEEGLKFAKGVKARIGADIETRVILVDEIKRPFKQKRRFIKSEVSKEFLGIKK